MSSENVTGTYPNCEVHVRECLVHLENQAKHTITILPRDGTKKGPLPLSDKNNVVIIPGWAPKGTIIMVYFFRTMPHPEDGN